jgi:hypothetical protein
MKELGHCICKTDGPKPCPEPREEHSERIEIHMGPDRAWRYHYTAYWWDAGRHRLLSQLVLGSPPRDKAGEKTEAWRAAWRAYRAPLLKANPRGNPETRDMPCAECGHELEHHIAGGMPCRLYCPCRAFKPKE